MNVQYDGSEGGMITKSVAKANIENYKQSATFITHNGIRGFLFGKDKIEEILQQNDCLGIRVYYGYERDINNSLKPQLIMVGTDVNGDDMTAGGKILDMGRPCPQNCPQNNAIDD